MKVLYLITRADLGGAQVHLLDLVQGFQSRCEPIVAVGEEGYLTEQLGKLGVAFHVVRSLVQPIDPVKDILALRELHTLIRRIQPHLIHAHTSKAGVLGRFAAASAGVPSIFTAHTWCFAENTSWKWKLFGTPAERIAARLSTKIINVSESNRMLALARGVGPSERLLTIHNGIPDSLYRANPGVATTPNALMVARFVPQKDQALLVRALATINAPLQVTFAGDGPTRPQVEQLAKDLKVADRITLLGARHDVPEIMSQAQIFALPTKWEGFPLTILEAMRAGLPVVASRVNGVPEAVTDGISGFLVEPGDEPGFVERLRLLVTDPALRARMGAAGRKDYESRFTSTVMLDSVWAVYSDVGARKRSPTPDDTPTAVMGSTAASSD